jgi:hypothetical protein
MPMRGWRIATISVVLLGACIATPAPASAAIRKVCMHRATAAVARDLGVRPGAVKISLALGGNGEPQCVYVTHPKPGHGPLTMATVTVNVDSGAQATWRLMRTVVEASQIFGVPPPGWKPPIGEEHLGPNASWFPELTALMATNGVDLLDASVIWRNANRTQRVALARAAITPYERDHHGVR